MKICDNREVKNICAVLGLAACHVGKMISKLQVRPAGQAGYPISLVASLDTVPVKCCVPQHANQWKRSFTFYIYSDVAHTLDKNWIIEVIRWELNPVNVEPNKMTDKR